VNKRFNETNERSKEGKNSKENKLRIRWRRRESKKASWDVELFHILVCQHALH